MAAVAERIISREVEAELPKYAGRYVAVTFSEILAAGDDPADVMAEARIKTTEVPILFLVPANEDRAYFF